ncbi:hypothetical protein Ddye_028152 [Dipteronia dyeriana]|uniref:Uncharacterized protein n=1 Tax=Dipteronia dyeriana TaxID=168575 RepID=A0AAD9TQH2_9ROSI|nr:hypothetical protein Ddye_028152 [Dipteronia dyeriana]
MYCVEFTSTVSRSRYADYQGPCPVWYRQDLHEMVDSRVVLISATLPHEILEMTTKFMKDHVKILVKRDELTLELPISTL